MTLKTQSRLLEYLMPKAAGTLVADVRFGLGYTAVLRTVSEGGGTMIIKKFVDFETVRVNF